MQPSIVSREEWMKQRMALLAEEKALTRARDALTQKRQALPWVKLEADYVFDGPAGPVRLADLFEGRSQLVVYHFMFAPEWEWGCKSCSFWADQFDATTPHLNARDTSFAAISRAPQEKLARHAKRLGWKFPWLSSGGSTFNYDFAVSFEPDAEGEVFYNYERRQVPVKEMQGYSIFVRTSDGAIHHAYSTYARGQDLVNSVYNVLDMTPKGRDEGERIMHWVKLHDEY